MKVAAEIVEREEEDLGENPHADHGKEGDRPQRKNEEICRVSKGSIAPEHERRVNRRDNIHYV